MRLPTSSYVYASTEKKIRKKSMYFSPWLYYKFFIFISDILGMVLLFANGLPVTNLTSCEFDVTKHHYSDVVMSAMASQITGVSVLCSIVCSGADKKASSKLSVTGLCERNPPVTAGGFRSQSASNAENISIWWHHHVFFFCKMLLLDRPLCNMASVWLIADWLVAASQLKATLEIADISQVF